MSQDVEHRLGRLENKLDDISRALISLARIEERVTAILASNDRAHIKLEDLDNRVTELEKASGVQGFVLRKGERLAWIFVTAALSASIAATLQ